jgi:sodium transport system permease protein
LVAATFARSFRDANSLLTPVLLVVLAPAFLASFPSAELDARWAVVPVAGPVLWMKALLLGKPVGSVALAVVGSSIAVAFLLLGLATRVFGDERVLFASEGRRADARTLFLGAPELGPGSALAFAATLFIGNYFATAFLVSVHPLAAVLTTQLLLHAGGAWLFVRWTRAPQLLSLGPSQIGAPRAVAGAVLIGGGAWLGISMPIVWIQSALVPGQEAVSAALKQSMSLEGTPLVLLIVVLAVVPAIAEELAFRGVVLGALRLRMSPGGAIFLSALLFSMAHGSLFRVLPTLVLGLFLGHLAQRTRTLWPSMLAHALNNGILLALDRAAPHTVAGLGSPTAWAGVGLAAVALGLVMTNARLTRATASP